MTTHRRPARQAATLEEVAARAGVSRATASRVLRGSSHVSDHARDAVGAAARELNYAPNLAARSLVTGRSESIAFLVDETEERMFSDPFFLTMLRSAHEAVGQTGRQLVFAVTATSADHDRFVEYAAGGHVDGVLLLSLHGPTKLPQRLEELGIPTMLSGRPLVGRRRLWFVDADNVDGGRLATEHLLRTGRRAVATVAGPSTMCAGIDRLAGYRVALEAADRPYDGSLVEVGEFTTASGHASMTRLLERRRDIDAVFVASDLTAIGAIRAIEASGRTVPDDVAVIGFDDIPDAAVQQPPLTTVRQPIAELAATMARLLQERIDGGTPPRQTTLPVELVLRATA